MIFLLPIIGIHLLLLFTTQFTLWPEMVVYPYLMNNGFELYRDIINPYQPLFLYFLSIFSKIIGYHPLPYQLLTYLFIVLIDLIIFKISFYLFKNKRTSYVSVMFFVIFSIPFGINGLWFDLVQTPLILGSIYFLYLFLKKSGQKTLFILSFFLTSAFFIKQQVIWLIIFSAASIIYQYRFKTIGLIKKNLLSLTIPLFAFFLIFAYVASKGILNDYVFWTLNFPFFASKLPGYLLLPSSRELVFIAALFGVTILCIYTQKKNQRIIAVSSLPLFLFVYPRFDFFHLVPALAVVSVSIGQASRSLNTLFKIILFSLLIILLSVLFVKKFQSSFMKETRFFEKDLIESCKQIASEVYPEKLVFLLNAPDQLLPIASLIPTKPWADDFPWYLEAGDTQIKVKDGLKYQNPSVIIFSPYQKGNTYELGAYQPKKIVEFVEENYEINKFVGENLILLRKTK